MNTATVYRVETVESCTPPRGLNGGWCRYVVTGGESRIVGRRRGSLSQTREEAERFASGLNSRVRTAASPWAPRRRKRA